jgi:PEP-CTERM/exosortase A-associated glycosyltransferase
MRILHLLDHSIPLQSGYSFRTLSILREQRALGWQTSHLTSPKQGAVTAIEETVDGFHFYRTALPPNHSSVIPGLGEIALMLDTARRLAQVVKHVRPDVLHAHSPVLNALPALWVGRRTGLPVVYEVRAFWEDGAVNLGTAAEGGLRYRLTRGLETYALKRVNAITTICEGLRKDIVARGIPAAKVTVIPNAVDAQDFSPDGVPDAVLKRKLGLQGARVIGYVGSFYAYEGLDTLIAALPRILAHEPDVRLLLAGGGPQEAALKQQAALLGLKDKVVFAGRVPHADVQRHYDLIDLLVYPRHSIRLTELVTPMKPLEAMAMGKLLIASDVGGHRELIQYCLANSLFRAGDAMDLARSALVLLQNPELWPTLRSDARRFVVRERNWSSSVERYRQVYESCLATAPAI